MTTVLLSVWTNTFYGIYISEKLGTLTKRLVHPTSPVLLTKNGPLRGFHHISGCSIKKHPKVYPFKVWELVQDVSSQMPLIISFTWYDWHASSYPEGNFGGNQLLDGSIGLSPYTQVWRTICTSVSLRASTRVSPGFTLLRHSSPSFGSERICSTSDNITREGRAVLKPKNRVGYLTMFAHSFTFISHSGLTP